MAPESTEWRPREVPNAQVFDAAEQYRIAYEHLASLPPGSGVLLPELQCAAIAVELCLKSLAAGRVEVPTEDEDIPGLVQVHARGQHGHGLIKLLEATEAEDYVAQGWVPVETAPSLRAALGHLEGLLEVSRYPFEKDNDIALYDLRIVAAVVKQLFTATNKLSGRF